jgi:hypothetical protein
MMTPEDYDTKNGMICVRTKRKEKQLKGEQAAVHSILKRSSVLDLKTVGRELNCTHRIRNVTERA